MLRKYAYCLPNGTIAIINSRSAVWEMLDDYEYLNECEVTKRYHGEENLRAVINGSYVYDL